MELQTEVLKLPEGLILQPNLEVYYKGEYLGIVQDHYQWMDNIHRSTTFTEKLRPERYSVWAKGDRLTGKTDTKEAGLYILWLDWQNQQNRKLSEVSQQLIGE